MFGHSFLLTSGAKVAVTATTINKTSACVFSNYNDEGIRRKDCGGLLLNLLNKNVITSYLIQVIALSDHLK